MKTSRNVIVGIFASVAVVLFLLVTVSLGSWTFLSDRVVYEVSFERVNKLTIGSPVNADGVPVGEVAKLQHVGGDRPVIVTIRIDRKIPLYPDAEVRVTPAPVIGDTEIHINQGTPQAGAPLEAGQEIHGVTSVGVEELAAEVGEELTKTLHAISAILNDTENMANIKTTVANLANITGRMDQTFESINREFEPALAEARSTTVKLNDLLESARKLTDQAAGDISATRSEANAALAAWTKTAQDTSREIEATSNQLQAAGADLQKMLAESREPLSQTLDGLTQASVNISNVIQAVMNGNGTLGRLINDPRPFEDFQRVMRTLAEKIAGSQPSAFDYSTEKTKPVAPRK